MTDAQIEAAAEAVWLAIYAPNRAGGSWEMGSFASPRIAKLCRTAARKALEAADKALEAANKADCVFFVSTNPDGEQRWWAFGEQIPITHTDIRFATVHETRLAQRILGSQAPKPELGAELIKLMAQTPPAGPTP